MTLGYDYAFKRFQCRTCRSDVTGFLMAKRALEACEDYFDQRATAEMLPDGPHSIVQANRGKAMSVHQLLPPGAAKLKCNGVGRDAEHDRCIVVYFNRRLTDDEMRFFHECSARTASLMEGI